MKTVIIGGVAGGAGCAARLRRLDESAEIVVLERGDYVSYANCGLPYHIGGTIKERSSLLLQSPEAMREKYNVDVRTANEVVAINRGKKSVTVKHLQSGEVYEESYDKLVISTGSSPLRPPIPGIDSPLIRTIWTVPDTDEVKRLLGSRDIRRAVVVGGGFIGLEMAENLKRRGLSVSIVEMSAQVMPPFDFEMAQLLHQHIEESGAALYLDDGVKEFKDDGKLVTVTLESGKTLDADIVILSIGVRPNGELAKAAGLELNSRGGIVVNDRLLTSDSDIYAVGDVIEVEDYIFKGRTMIPLAGPANKQGRIAADNIAGMDEVYRGTQGSSVAKIFDMTAASTGVNEKTLLSRGMSKGSDYESVIITQNSHAGYYPCASPLTLKLLFSSDGKIIFGAQIIGRDGVDKRIDTIAAAIRMGGGIDDLKDFEFAYAPPYSSAKDPVNMAGFTADNVINGRVRFSAWDDPDKTGNAALLDVREEVELAAFTVPNSVNIPLGQLRGRLQELDKSGNIIIFCAIGVRAYFAARILAQNGFKNVSVYPGGARFYQSTHFSHGAAVIDKTQASAAPAAPAASQSSKTKSISLDCSGMQCPGPLMKVYETVSGMEDGDVLEVTASDPGFMRDIAAWCKSTGNTLLSKGQQGAYYTASVKKGSDGKTAAPDRKDGKTIIVFSGDLDKVIASFIIANGAAAMGGKVTMFFTFWGLTALRKPEKQPVKKSVTESMFSSMLPRGSKKLKLSRMNMGGMGTAMMKKVMGDKNVDSLEELIKKAVQNGVKLVACTMSMDVMGIQKEELIDGVELAGVGSYLGDAEESNLNLFI